MSSSFGDLLLYARLWGLLKILETGVLQDFFSSGDSRGTFNSFTSAPPYLCGLIGAVFWAYHFRLTWDRGNCWTPRRWNCWNGRRKSAPNSCGAGAGVSPIGGAIAGGLPERTPLLAGEPRSPSGGPCAFGASAGAAFLPLLLCSQMLGVIVVLSAAPRVWDYQYAFALLELSLACTMGYEMSTCATGSPGSDHTSHAGRGVAVGGHESDRASEAKGGDGGTTILDRRCAFILAAAQPVLGAQLGLLYLFAGVWKVNSTFLDPRVSCAPALWAQLLAKYFWWLGAGANAFLVGKVSILGTTAVEIGLGALMLLPAGAHRRAAWLAGVFAVGLPFHLLIAVCPSPNGAGGFSCAAAVWYFWLLPLGTRNPSPASGSTSDGSISGAALRVAAALFVLGLFALALERQDFAMPVYGILVVMLGAELARRRAAGAGCEEDFGAKLLEVGAAGPEALGPSPSGIGNASSGDGKTPPAPTIRAAGHPLLILIFLAWTFGSAFLGLQDMGADTMYAGLQVYGFGSGNHLFLPAGVYLQYYYSQRPSQGAGAGPGGRSEGPAEAVLYRVDGISPPPPPSPPAAASPSAASAASSYLSAMYPAETELEPAPAAADLLRLAGHSGRMFSPGGARVLGAAWAEQAAPRAAARRAKFQPYVVPELELRRMVGEAGGILRRGNQMLFRNETLEINVSPLAARSNGSLVFDDGRLVVEGSGLAVVVQSTERAGGGGAAGSVAGLSVQVRCAGSSANRGCSSPQDLARAQRLETALRAAPSSWMLKSLAFFPIPLGADGEGHVSFDGVTLRPAGCVA